jgi:hypothetical protein
MKVIEKNEGPKIAYEVTGTKITFGDDELTINVAKYQRDWPVYIDICSNRDKQLVIGTGDGLYYVAQLDVPEIKYTEPETEGEAPEPLPIDMSEVVLTLWSLEHPVPAEI